MCPAVRRVCLGVGLIALALAASCAGMGDYVWFQQVEHESGGPGGEYVIGVGDMVSIKVFGHDEMSLSQRVRSDGRISVLLIGDVEARGKRPSALKAELEGRLKDYIVGPNVLVNIEETQPASVLLVGEIAHPGAVPLEPDPRLVHAIVMGGGLSEYASKSGIFVVRREPRPVRIRFEYDAIIRNIGGAGDFPLRRGDLVEVE